MPEEDASISLEELQALIDLVETHGLTELSVEEEGVRVTLRTGQPAASAPTTAQEVPVAAAPPPAGTAPAPTVPTAAEDTAHYVAIRSPMAGVFYRRPRPDDPPYVEEGDTVEEGQPVGLIEAMKIFSEVLADTRGRVAAIPAQNGAMVQEGSVLVLLEPLANGAASA
jgi:acetyl-CoA carboxylase biotin carboxyl carrier protein